jgi:hypothetical protein
MVRLAVAVAVATTAVAVVAVTTAALVPTAVAVVPEAQVLYHLLGRVMQERTMDKVTSQLVMTVVVLASMNL